MFQPLKASYQWTARLAASRPGKVERLGHPPPQHHVISRNNYLTADLAAQMCRTLKTKVDRKSAWIENTYHKPDERPSNPHHASVITFQESYAS
jgi:hypothetical protein